MKMIIYFSNYKQIIFRFTRFHLFFILIVIFVIIFIYLYIIITCLILYHKIFNIFNTYVLFKLKNNHSIEWLFFTFCIYIII